MESCANTCQRMAPLDAADTAKVMDAAETLACLLTDQPDFQNFLRLSRAVRLDPEVEAILDLMNEYPTPETYFNEARDQELEARMEALPVMRSYRITEQAARAMFAAVEQVISAAAGVPFAEYAKASACG